MSDKNDRGIRDFSMYDEMETAELEEILRLDAEAPEGEESDLELIFYVMGVLADRRKRSGNFTGKTAEQAYETFIQHYLPEVEEPENSHVEKSKRRPVLYLRKLTAAAAVLLIVIFGSVTAKAFGVNVWQIVATWAQETFCLSEAGKTDAPKVDDEREYESLLDVIGTENGAPDVVPTWIPNGYELNDIDIFETPIQKRYVARYINGEMELTITIKSYLADNPTRIEQSEGFVEIYKSEDIGYYMFSNFGQSQAAWINENYECVISGELPIDELKMMIDSIGKG